jgi:hypothetical protein
VILLKSITSSPIQSNATGYVASVAPKTQYQYTTILGNTPVAASYINVKNENFHYVQNVLSSIINPLGKIETFIYKPIKTGIFNQNAGAHSFSFTVLIGSAEAPLKRMVSEDITSFCADAQRDALKRPVSGLNLELNLLVDKISVSDPHGIRTTEYSYTDLVFFYGTPSFGVTVYPSNNFYRGFEYTGSDIRYGFKQTTVLGPERKYHGTSDNLRLTTQYFHKTTELPEALLWGKLYKVEEHFQSPTNFTQLLLHSKREIDYEVLLAFENPWHRGRKQTPVFDYEDYFTVSGGVFSQVANRPSLALAPIQSATSPDMNTYYTGLHTFYGIGATHVGTPSPAHTHSSHLRFDNTNKSRFGAFFNSVYLYANFLMDTHTK